MNPRRMAFGVTALVGFLACTALSAGLLPALSPCCSDSCEPCPIVICKSTPASPSSKVDAAHALPFAGLVRFVDFAAPAAILSLGRIPTSLPPEFRRPMRS